MKTDYNFKHLLPPLSQEQKEELEQDILKNGCLSPLFTWNGILIDGYHRYEICTKHNLPFETVKLNLKDELEAMQWAWNHQKNRRNCTKYELTVLALKFKPAIEERARENQLSSLVQNAVSQKSVERSIDTQKEIASIAGVSHDTVHKVETIEAQAPPEIKEKIIKGEMSINRAYNEIKPKPATPLVEQMMPLNSGENVVSISELRKKKEHEDPDKMSIPEFDKYIDFCGKVANGFNKVIHNVAMLEVDDKHLNAWKEILPTPNKKKSMGFDSMVDEYIQYIDAGIPKLIRIRNFLKELKKNE